MRHDRADVRGGHGLQHCLSAHAGKCRLLGLQSDLERAAKDYAQHLLKKRSRALAEVKARINAIASNGIPVVNAMTEGFLDRG